MRISVLVENESFRPELQAEHGLSLYIEVPGVAKPGLAKQGAAKQDYSNPVAAEESRGGAGGKTILLDAGQKELFAQNAKLMGCDLAAVDFAVLSHGHSDHAGGLPLFRILNPRAPVFMAKAARKPNYIRRCGVLFFNVGIPRDFTSDPGTVLLSEDTEIFPGVHAVTSIRQKSPYLTSSTNLYMRKGLWFAKDDFSHELALVVNLGECSFVFSSCSHLGLHDIMAAIAEKGLLKKESHVFAGMHLYLAMKGTSESPEILDRFAEALRAFEGSTYYTGHCTGKEAFDRLKVKLGERLQSMHCGDVFVF